MNLHQALKAEYTEEQEIAIGLKLAEIFGLRKKRENGRYQLNDGWGDKSALGLCRTFRQIALRVDEKDLDGLHIKL